MKDSLIDIPALMDNLEFGSTKVSNMKHTSVEDLSHDPNRGNHFVVIPVEEVNKPAMNALQYARLLGGQATAVHVLIDSSDRDGFEYRWKLYTTDIPLFILGSPNGSVLEPLREFVDELLKRNKRSIVTILLPVITGLKWWQRFLHNQTELLIERTFQSKDGVVTVRVPFSLNI